MHYRLELLNVISEFLKDIDKAGRGSRGNLNHAFVAKLEEHGKETVVNCVRVEKLSEFAKVLGENQLSSPFVLGFSDSVDILYVFNELMAVFGLYFSQEYVEVSQRANLNIIDIVLQESLHDGNQVCLSDFGP